MAHYMATNGIPNTNGVLLRAQGWYSLDAGSSFTKMGTTSEIVVSNAPGGSGFVNFEMDFGPDTRAEQLDIETMLALAETVGGRLGT